MKTYSIITLLCFAVTTQAHAEQAKATLYHLTRNGQGSSVGTIVFTDTDNGLSVTENLMGLPAGPHGIHIHENGSCASTTANGKTVLGGAAGGHYDPNGTGHHAGPNGDGHKGDLPVLQVQEDGTAVSEFYLQNVTVSDFKGRAVVIHAGGDNYNDTPQPLGGGGDRIACGVIE